MQPPHSKPEPCPAVFLDRDGTVCVEKGYLASPAEIELLPGSAEAIRHLNRSGMAVVIISNQSGVARGYFSEKTVQAANAALIKILSVEEAHIDGIYYCPHHPEGQPPFNMECDCRKPRPGMVEQAARELHLSIPRSVIIGDKMSDVQTATGLGIPGILVLTGYGQREKAKIGSHLHHPPDYIAIDLPDAVRWWLQHMRG